MDVEWKMRYWASKLLERPGGDVMECGLRWAVEARRKKRGEEKRQQEQEEQLRQEEQEQGRREEQEQRRQEEQEQIPGQEQGKEVCLGEEEQFEETRSENAGEPEVTGRTVEVRTGRGSAGLVRGGDERHWADESSRKGKGKGNGGKGEHGGKGGVGSKGTQQVENSVTDEGQENTRTMKDEREEEEYRWDVRRKVVRLIKREEDQEADEEDEQGRVAPNRGQVAHTSRPRRTPEREKKRRERHEC